jgi:hypothetical protein
MAEDKKKPAAPAKTPALKDAPATQKISKEELAALIKKAEEDEAADKGGKGGKGGKGDAKKPKP